MCTWHPRTSRGTGATSLKISNFNVFPDFPTSLRKGSAAHLQAARVYFMNLAAAEWAKTCGYKLERRSIHRLNDQHAHDAFGLSNNTLVRACLPVSPSTRFPVLAACMPTCTHTRIRLYMYAIVPVSDLACNLCPPHPKKDDRAYMRIRSKPRGKNMHASMVAKSEAFRPVENTSVPSNQNKFGSKLVRFNISSVEIIICSNTVLSFLDANLTRI